MTSVQLAQASNAAVYATMVTLAIAMVFFAVSFAAGRRRAPAAGVRRARSSRAVAALPSSRARRR